MIELFVVSSSVEINDTAARVVTDTHARTHARTHAHTIHMAIEIFVDAALCSYIHPIAHICMGTVNVQLLHDII